MEQLGEHLKFILDKVSTLMPQQIWVSPDEHEMIGRLVEVMPHTWPMYLMSVEGIPFFVTPELSKGVWKILDREGDFYTLGEIKKEGGQ